MQGRLLEEEVAGRSLGDLVPQWADPAPVEGGGDDRGEWSTRHRLARAAVPFGVRFDQMPAVGNSKVVAGEICAGHSVLFVMFKGQDQEIFF